MVPTFSRARPAWLCRFSFHPISSPFIPFIPVETFLIVSKSSSRDTRADMGRRLHAQPDLRSWTSPLEGRVLYGGNRANEARNLTHYPLSPRGNWIRDFYPRPRGGAANGAGGPTRVTFLGGAVAHCRNLSKTLPELTIGVGQIDCVATTRPASQCYTLPGRTAHPAA